MWVVGWIHRLVQDVAMAERLVINALALLVLTSLLFFAKTGSGDRVNEPTQLIDLPPKSFSRASLVRFCKQLVRSFDIEPFAPEPPMRATIYPNPLAEVFRFQEQEMLKQMRKTGAACFLTGRTNVCG